MKVPYRKPELEELGPVADLTQVGETFEGDDTYPSERNPNEDGSVCPSPDEKFC